MKTKRSPWLVVLGLASLVVACGAPADPEPTGKQGEDLLPVKSGGPGGGTSSGKSNPCAPANPDNPSTWYCGPQAQCAPPCASEGLVPECNNTTDYVWICVDIIHGSCSHGCAPAQ